MDRTINALDRAIIALKEAAEAADLPDPSEAGMDEASERIEANSLIRAVANARHARETRDWRQTREAAGDFPPRDERSTVERVRARDLERRRLHYDLRAAADELQRNFVSLPSIVDEYGVPPAEIGLTYDLRGEVFSMIEAMRQLPGLYSPHS